MVQGDALHRQPEPNRTPVRAGAQCGNVGVGARVAVAAVAEGQPRGWWRQAHESGTLLAPLVGKKLGYTQVNKNFHNISLGQGQEVGWNNLY